jgi:hypothetical protein
VGALATARALGASSLPLTGALEQLAETQTYLLEPAALPPRLIEYVEYTPQPRPKPKKIVIDDSAWDPDTHDQQMEVSRCRALLLEIIRRAAHDWILYRTHAKLSMRQIAEDAHTWLFVEGPKHTWWHMRRRTGAQLTSFLGICELLDLDPPYVRQRVRSLTPRQIMTAGRPSERRKRPVEEPSYTTHEVADVSLEDIEDSAREHSSYRDYSMYEAQFTVMTPGYV